MDGDMVGSLLAWMIQLLRLPKRTSNLSPEYYRCKAYEDGTPVEFINEPAPSGTFIRTSIGWMSTAEDLRN
jgi:hypothetical protein